jgi:hypothetical protein
MNRASHPPTVVPQGNSPADACFTSLSNVRRLPLAPIAMVLPTFLGPLPMVVVDPATDPTDQPWPTPTTSSGREGE